MTRTQLLNRMRSDVKVFGSQSALARSIGISKAYVCDILKGRRQPGPAVLDYYGLTVKLKPVVREYVENGKK